jgi:hypothetical protein
VVKEEVNRRWHAGSPCDKRGKGWQRMMPNNLGKTVRSTQYFSTEMQQQQHNVAEDVAGLEGTVFRLHQENTQLRATYEVCTLQ